VEGEHADKIIGDAMMDVGISQELDTAVREIEERHMGIVKLERQVREIYELFRDLATLVDLQQETMDIIDQRISSAKAYTEKAVEEMRVSSLSLARALSLSRCPPRR
jgi:syntaxin 1B/2/3